MKIAYINTKDIERAKAVKELSKILISKWNKRYENKSELSTNSTGNRKIKSITK